VALLAEALLDIAGVGVAVRDDLPIF